MDAAVEPKSPRTADRILSRNVAILRRAAGLSLHQAADAVGITFQAFHKLESGQFRIAAQHLPMLAALLGVDIDALFAPISEQEGRVLPISFTRSVHNIEDDDTLIALCALAAAMARAAQVSRRNATGERQ